MCWCKIMNTWQGKYSRRNNEKVSILMAIGSNRVPKMGFEKVIKTSKELSGVGRLISSCFCHCFLFFLITLFVHSSYIFFTFFILSNFLTFLHFQDTFSTGKGKHTRSCGLRFGVTWLGLQQARNCRSFNFPIFLSLYYFYWFYFSLLFLFPFMLLGKSQATINVESSLTTTHKHPKK